MLTIAQSFNTEPLRLAVLGPPVVEVGDRPVAFRSRKEFALLVYLALSRTPRSREHLASLLWPDRDEISARGTLRTALSRLRQAVAAAGGMSPEELTLFQTGRDALGREVIRVIKEGAPCLALDTASVERAAAAKVEQIGLPSYESELMQAVAAYHGPFLADVPLHDTEELQDWVHEQRAYWERQIEGILGRLAALQLDRRALIEASATAERWLTIDPMSEGAYRVLMRARAEAGDRAGALAAYEECRAVLRSQLGLDPSPETVALAERQRRLMLPAAHAPATSEVSTVLPKGDGPAPRELDLPFVGRVREFAALVEAYQAARAGETRVVVLEGEAKIGKSRLAEEFLRWATLEGADVVRGRGLGMKADPPYHVFVDALRPRLAREHAPEDLVDDVWLTELVRLFPELRERYPDLPAPAQLAEGATGMGRLFEAVYQLVTALAEHARPGALIGFLDDLQWCDQPSLDLILHGTERGHDSGAPILVILTVRTEALAAAPALERWLTRLGRSVPTVHLALGPLGGAEIEQAIENVVAPTGAVADGSNRALAEALHAQTDGHPFFLIEVLRALIERGVLVSQEAHDNRVHRTPVLGLDRDVDGLPRLVPQTVRDLIHNRLGGLRPAGYDLVAAATVLGSEATFEELCEVVGLDEWDALAALDQLRRRRLLVEHRPDPALGGEASDRLAAYRFPYELVREVVAAEVGDTRRRVLMLRVKAIRERGRVSPSDSAGGHIPTVEQESPLLSVNRAGATRRVQGVSRTPRVLLIEDEPAEARLLRELLAELPELPFALDWASSLSAGLQRLSDQLFDLVLLDLFLPDAQDLDGLRIIRARFPGIPVVVLTGVAAGAIADEAIGAGAQDSLARNELTGAAIARTVRYAIERERRVRNLVGHAVKDSPGEPAES